MAAEGRSCWWRNGAGVRRSVVGRWRNGRKCSKPFVWNGQSGNIFAVQWMKMEKQNIFQIFQKQFFRFLRICKLFFVMSANCSFLCKFS